MLQQRQALRARLDNAQTELTAMTLALEESRKRAEETLTLLAAAEAAKDEAAAQADRRLSEAEGQAALLAVAQDKLASQEALSAEGQRKVALLNAQVAQLSTQLRQLQAVLDATGAAKGEAEVRIGELGNQLNAALLRAAEAEKVKAALESERAARAEAEAKDLTRYRSEFFGRLSQILAGRPGVTVVGDRFAFSSDVVFPAATWYEKHDLSSTDMHPFVHAFTPAIDPPWEAKSDFDTFHLIAKRLSEMAVKHLGVRKDLVSVAMQHDTRQAMANRGGDTANHLDHVHINSW